MQLFSIVADCMFLRVLLNAENTVKCYRINGAAAWNTF